MKLMSSGLTVLVRKTAFYDRYWNRFSPAHGPNNHLSLTSPAISCQVKIGVVISLQPRDLQFQPPGFSMSDGKQAPQNIQDAFLNTVRREKALSLIHISEPTRLLSISY